MGCASPPEPVVAAPAAAVATADAGAALAGAATAAAAARVEPPGSLASSELALLLLAEPLDDADDDDRRLCLDDFLCRDWCFRFFFFFGFLDPWRRPSLSRLRDRDRCLRFDLCAFFLSALLLLRFFACACLSRRRLRPLWLLASES